VRYQNKDETDSYNSPEVYFVKARARVAEPGQRRKVEGILPGNGARLVFLFQVRGYPSQVKGAGLRALSRRRSSVRIAPLAFF